MLSSRVRVVILHASSGSLGCGAQVNNATPRRWKCCNFDSNALTHLILTSHVKEAFYRLVHCGSGCDCFIIASACYFVDNALRRGSWSSYAFRHSIKSQAFSSCNLGIFVICFDVSRRSPAHTRRGAQSINLALVAPKTWWVSCILGSALWLHSSTLSPLPVPLHPKARPRRSIGWTGPKKSFSNFIQVAASVASQRSECESPSSVAACRLACFEEPQKALTKTCSMPLR
ncbi:hypothetical protein QBC34DRAFT_46924 [Podospora aff. communis PSN243]|uniref:Secreted protein n=1 Tax=Podospora aff. communis PSN243 TaxID=3040156 RepID=A0AAV9GST3_9PEZI|nr:hypothetical protein QBC34DRAFT_46924 [Podospora aff. communis PSN243]